MNELFEQTYSPELLPIALLFYQCEFDIKTANAPTVEHVLHAEELIDALNDTSLLTIFKVIKETADALVVSSTPVNALMLTAVLMNATLVSHLLCFAAATAVHTGSHIHEVR